MRISAWAVAATLCLPRASGAAPGRMLEPDVTRATRLCGPRGAACTIIAPRGRDDVHGKRVLQALTGRRTTPPALIGPEEALAATGPRLRDQLMKQPVVVLGNINTNRALLPFYARFRCFADADYPGPGAYTIRTAYRPWGTKINAVLVGASDDAGLSAGVSRLVELLAALPRDGILDFPYTMETQGARALPGAANPRDARVDPRRTAADGYAYAVTGGKHFVRRTLANLRAVGDDGGKGFPYSDYGLDAPARAWTLVYPSPHLTNEERREIDQRFLDYAFAHQNDYWRARSGGRIGGRHQTMGTWAFYTVAKHLLQRANPDAAARTALETWIAQCRAYFDFFTRTWHDDMEGIPSFHAIQPAIHYALEEGIGDFLYSERLRNVVIRALAVTDNMGYYCGTGTYEEARPGTLTTPIALGYPAAVAAYCGRDPGMKWLWQTFCGKRPGLWTPVSMYGLRLFATTDAVGSVPPTAFLGIQASRFDRQYYRRITANSPNWIKGAPYERTFDKLAFRDTYERNAQYLVLEGKQYTRADNLPPLDANAILRFADRGQVWLHSNSMLSGNFHRNAIWVTDGVGGGPQAAVCELLHQATTRRVGLVRSRLSSYHGTTWDRTVFWLRGDAFAVIDTLRVDDHKGKELTAVCTWRSPAHPRLDGDVWEARVGDARFALLNADPDVRLSSRFEGLEGAAETTLLRQFRAGRLGLGDTMVFRNLFYASDSSDPRRFRVRPLGRSAMLVRDDRTGDVHLMAVRTGGKEIDFGAVVSDADALLLSPRGVLTDGAKKLLVGGAPVERTVSGKIASRSAGPTLSALWDRTPPLRRSAPAEQDGGTLGEAWRFAGATRPGEPVRGCRLSARPDPSGGRLEELVDALVPLWTGQVSWSGDGKPVLTFHLPEEVELTEIEVRTGFVAGVNTRPDEAKLSPLPPCKATFILDDGAVAADIELKWEPGYNAEQLHKAEFYPIGRQRARGFEQRAKRVTLAFAGPFRAKEIILRTSQPALCRVTRLQARDLDGDGSEEILAVTERNELIVLSAGGEERWRRRFNGPINALFRGPLEAGGEPRVLVGTLESLVYALSASGEELWRADTLFLGDDCPGPFSIATWRPRPEGPVEVIVGNYARCSFFGADGRRLGWSKAAGAFETMTLTAGLDLNDDGCEDALMYNNWRSLSIIDGKQRKMVGAIPCPGGLGLVLERIDQGGGEPRILIATDTGVGILRPKAKTYDFRLETSPVSACLYADLDDSGDKEIVIGKLDGYVIALDGRGTVLHRTALGEPVRALAVLPRGPARLLVACENSIRFLSPQLRELSAVPGRRIERLLSHPAGIVAAEADGSIVLLR